MNPVLLPKGRSGEKRGREGRGPWGGGRARFKDSGRSSSWRRPASRRGKAGTRSPRPLHFFTPLWVCFSPTPPPASFRRGSPSQRREGALVSTKEGLGPRAAGSGPRAHKHTGPKAPSLMRRPRRRRCARRPRRPRHCSADRKKQLKIQGPSCPLNKRSFPFTGLLLLDRREQWSSANDRTRQAEGTVGRQDRRLGARRIARPPSSVVGLHRLTRQTLDALRVFRPRPGRPRGARSRAPSRGFTGAGGVLIFYRGRSLSRSRFRLNSNHPTSVPRLQRLCNFSSFPCSVSPVVSSICRI